MTTELPAARDSSIQDASGAAGSAAVDELKTSAAEIKSESKAGLAHTQPRAREVEYSCRLVAALRAQESLRKDALFRDPFAAALAGGDHLMDHGHFIVRQDQERSEASRKRAAEQIAAMQAERAERPEIVIRTHFIDCLLRDCARERERWQVVLLGAGLDSRANRLECLARCAVFEVDQASVIAYKRAKLAEIAEAKLLAASLAHVPGDLSRPVSAAVVAPMLSKDRRYVAEERKQRISSVAETTLSEHSAAADSHSKSDSASAPVDDWAAGLLAAGFSRKDPTIWIAEGVLMYLNERQVRPCSILLRC
jgi:O-methyltransferase involved in polyketide biosynthesis